MAENAISFIFRRPAMKTVGLAMSGGVDSSAAALLLQQQGYKVIGITMDIGSGDACEKAAKVAADLGIEHHVLPVKDDFRKCVVDYFIND